MQTITLREANQHLSRYAAQVQEGVEIIVTKRGKPAFKLVPIPPQEMNAAEREALIHKALSFRMTKPYGKKFERSDAYED